MHPLERQEQLSVAMPNWNMKLPEYGRMPFPLYERIA
jgi:hypothetical protein